MKPTDFQWVILDTSAFIESCRYPSSVIGKHVRSLIEIGMAAITPVIRWEMGRGKISKSQKIEIQEYLDSLELLDWKIDWNDLDEFDATMRKEGFVIPLTDLWIAQTAIEWSSFLLHKDKHYDLIASCTPLRIWNPS